MPVWDVIGGGMPHMFIVIMVAFILLAIFLAVVLYIAERKRREALQAVARRLGLQYYARDHYELPSVFASSSLCGRGHSRRATNIIGGSSGAGALTYFDYRFTEGHGKESHTYNASACGILTPCSFPRLAIRPENFLDKAAGLVGFSDINLDLAEFNSRFHVECADKKFAYDVLHQRAMEFLLGRPDVSIEMMGNFFLFYYNSRLSAERVERLIRDAVAFAQLMPEYLKQECGFASPDAVPGIDKSAGFGGGRPGGVTPERPRGSWPGGKA